MSSPNGLLRWLGQAARDARTRNERTQSQIAAELGINRETVSRFETGKRWPRDPDAIVRAYARDLGIPPIEIWEDALTRWRAS